MHIIIAGGTGFIGQALVTSLLKQNIKVSVIGRSANNIAETFANQVNSLTWDQLESKHAVKYLQTVDAIINLAGANIGSQRWNAARKQEIIDSRVKPTQILANLCAQAGEAAPPLLNANGIGIYGTQIDSTAGLPPALTEQSSLSLIAGTDFLAEVGRLWEQATAAAENASVRVVKMRFAAVLGRDGGALAKMLPAYRLGLGGKVGSGHQPFSWVALDDLIKAIHFIIMHEQIRGPVNIVAPGAVSQLEFAQTLAEILHRPRFLTMPAGLIKLLFGQMGEELLLHGQHISPDILLANGFVFDYPQLKPALEHILL